MEEQDERVDPAFLKGFNEGYIMERYMPELTEQLISMGDENPRNQGFKAGREQYQSERLKERLPTWLKDTRNSKEQPTPGKTRDRGIEPEKG